MERPGLGYVLLSSGEFTLHSFQDCSCLVHKLVSESVGRFEGIQVLGGVVMGMGVNLYRWHFKERKGNY